MSSENNIHHYFEYCNYKMMHKIMNIQLKYA